MENIGLNCSLVSVHYSAIHLQQLLFSKSLKYENEIFKLRRSFCKHWRRSDTLEVILSYTVIAYN